MTNLARSTVQDAWDGEKEVNALAVIAILRVVTTEDVAASYVAKHCKDMYDFFEDFLEAKISFSGGRHLSLFQCCLLSRVSFEGSIDESETSFSDPRAQKAIARLIKDGIVANRNGFLSLAAEWVVPTAVVMESLAKYAAYKLDSEKRKSFTSALFYSVDDETAEILFAIIKKLEEEFIKVIKQGKPGPNKLAAVSFITSLGEQEECTVPK